MQHTWDIRVTQKSAAREQRFVVAGAATNNGPHPGVVGSPVVTVRGSSWSIVIQSKIGTTWVNSTEQIQFPTSAASGFSILSDDYGANPDLDFNDLVLHCTPVATSGATDYFTYGNVSCYTGICWRNPCFRGFIVIDSLQALTEALRYPQLKDYLKKVYPDRLFEVPVKLPIPQPDPPPFIPMMLPVQGDALLPQKEATLFRREIAEKVATKSAGAKAAAEETFIPVGTARYRGLLTDNTAVFTDRNQLATLLDKFRFICDVNPMPFSILRFLEYDRTNAELAGGPYTGTGTGRFWDQQLPTVSGTTFSATSAAILKTSVRPISTAHPAKTSLYRPGPISLSNYLIRTTRASYCANRPCLPMYRRSNA